MRLSVFREANGKLGADVILWGQTGNLRVEIVLVRYPSANLATPFVAYCFDNGTGDFYHAMECRTLDDGKLAFFAKVENEGLCDFDQDRPDYGQHG